MSQSFHVKKTILMMVAIGTVAIPLFVSAAIKHDAGQTTTVIYAPGVKGAAQTPQDLYKRLKNAARKMCGSNDIVLTGSIERVAGNESCYEGTLDAAVRRLNDPEVNELHEREISQL